MSHTDSVDPLYNRSDYSTNSNPTEIECWNLLLDWNIDFTKKLITGKATHEVCILKDGTPSANFDISGLVIEKVLLDNEKATFSVTEAGANSVVKVVIPKALQMKGTVVKIEFIYSTGEEASAMQWLDAAATQGKKYPYLFTQSQAIHARSMFPCFDSPGVKTPYSATVRAPDWCTVLMSALSVGSAVIEGKSRIFKWNQPVPVPAYLVALAAGQLASIDISPRVRVWSEPESVEAAAWEFHQTEEFLRAAELLTCDYQWQRYDILNLPPSFPYGGMENPCLTFATPTLLAGDRSLANVIAHEIAHSWTGNLVTNATWSHFWLNEGWTVWLERNIMQLVTGSKDKYKLSAQGGYKHLEDDLQRLSPEWSSLVWPLRPGSDPDDAFSSVPYEKGFALLAYLESLVGEPPFKEFVRAYVQAFKFSTVTSGQFRDFFCGFFSDRADLLALDWVSLFTAQGPPQHPLVDLSNPLADAASDLVKKIAEFDAAAPAAKVDLSMLPSIQGWSTDQKTLFLDKLLEHASTAPLREVTLIKLNQVYGLNAVRNAEIKFRWQLICLKSNVSWIFPLVTEFVLSQGRMKYVRPLYRALRESGPTGQTIAIETFTQNSKIYHPVARKMVASDLNVDLSVQSKKVETGMLDWKTITIISTVVVGAIFVARSLLFRRMGNSGLRHMGNQPAQDPRTYFQTDLPNFIYQDRIGNGKFMKTYIVKVKGVPFVVKVYMKAADENLQSVSLELSNLWKTISPSRYPNLLPYQMWIKSAKPTRNNVYPVYLIRQYMQSSLHDRLSTRPFLTQVEKLWLMYQLFKALEVCHMSHGIIHGDIKPENVMCTSWNWLVLTDFGTFKPANLPDDDPTDFQFYFDTMGRNSCYIAPERFYRREVKNNPGDAQADSPVDSAAKVAAQQLTSAIDVFSLGCTLAEIFLDGEKFILLPGMLQYVGTSGAKKIARTGGLERLDQEDSPVRAALNKISSKLVRDVIIDMTQRRPDLRTNVRNYRHILEGRRPPSSMVTQGGAIGQRVVEMEKPASSAPFPEFFAQTVYPVFQKLHTHGITPDDRIIILCENYDAILAGITGQEDPEGLAFFKHSVKGIIGARTQSSIDAGGMNAFSAFGGKSSGNENEALPFHPDALPAARLRPHDLMGPLLSAPWSAMPVQWAAKNAAAIKNTENAPSLSINPNLDLAIDELMERCQELIDRMDTNKPKPYNGPSSQSMPAAGTASSGLFGKSNASSSSSASAAGLASAALKASYGIDTLMHAQVNPGFSSTIPLLDRPLQSSFGEPNERLMHEGMLLPVQVVCASFRSLKFPHAKIVAIMLLVRLGSMCEDDVILHRIVPTLLQAVGDLVAQVRAAAVRALCSLLALVRNVDAIESNLFPQYLFPELSTRIARELEPIVRVAFAECAGRYAETSKRFLDQAHLAAQSKTLSGDFDTDESNVGGKGGAKVKDSTPLVAFQYDAKLRALHDHVNLWIKELLLDSSRAGLAQGRQVNRKATTRKRPTFSGSLDTLVHSSSVIRRVLLVDVVRLCAFFGHDALDVLLQHVLTFLNDADWEVRYAFCAKIASICAFVGPTVTIERILPCIENALYDVEERVAVRAVQCLSTLVQLGLVSAVSVLVEIAKLVVPLVLHPRANVRSAAITAFASALSVANIADAVVFLLPLLRPVQLMELPGGDLSKEALRKMLTGPVSYASFNAAIYDQLKQYKSSSNNQLVTSGKLVATPVSKGTSVEDSGTALSLDDLKLHSYSGTVVDPSDKIKLTVLVKYIDGLAREINAKSNLLRSANSNTTSRDPVTQSPANNTNATSNSTIKILQESDLELVTINMSECIEDSLLVPHQKGDGRFFANFSSEQSRRVLINNPAAIRSLKKIRACYGLYSQESAKRALTSGVLPEPILDTDSSDGPSKAASPLQRKPNGLGKQTSEMMLGADATTDDNSSADTQTLLRRIKALALPPLPPDVGSLSSPEERRLDPAEIPDPNARLTWRPRENTLVASLQEHSLGVNQLAVAPDLVFFASASSDSTVKIWRVRGIDKAPVARSALTYRKHQGAVTSVAVLENSHSVASASEDGSVHVWRVDSVSELPPLGSTDRDSEGARYAVPCSSEIRQLQPSEGAVVAVSHYSSDVASVVTYLTQNGGLHAWDLRASREAFQFGVRPELGQATAMAMAPDRNWICVGTTHGFVSLWDIRFNTQAKLWRHSSSGPIHRLASCKSLPGVTPQMQQKAYATRSEHLIGSAEGAYLFVAAGNNEAAVWALPEGGECLKCFRSIPLRASRQPLAPLPILREVNLPRHPLSPIFSAVDNYGVKKFGPADVGPTYNPLENSYRSVLGRISEKGASYLITAGTDRVIRYWDFSSPTKCFTVSGLLPCQPRPAYETPMSEGLLGKLFLSFDAATPSADVVSQSDLPRREGRGPLPPSSNFKDAILDLKSIDVPVRLLMAASRDGDIKLWR